MRLTQKAERMIYEAIDNSKQRQKQREKEVGGLAMHRT
jgi:hypothetical protein